MTAFGTNVRLAAPRCRSCGCTDARACPGGCYWVEPDLCSACAGPLVIITYEAMPRSVFVARAISRFPFEEHRATYTRNRAGVRAACARLAKDAATTALMTSNSRETPR